VTGGLIALVVVLLAATGFGLAWRRREGRLRTGGRASRGGQLTEADLREPLGRRATLVQFSSAFCAPCRATRQVLADVARAVDGVTHVEIDAESRLELVRRLDIYTTPTVLVLGPDGGIAVRASGQPREADVIAAIGKIA
jgi:thiol-disulfide isomerase/thioredoxin